MRDDQCYKVQLVGNLDTVKRMVASLFLVDGKKEKQTLKVCICDDLPHVINAVDNQQRSSPGHELIQSGLILQVGYGRNLTIRATSQDENDLCVVNPQIEVVIPSEAVWASNAAFATDFQLHLQRAHENAAVQVSITSKDDYDSDIPLSVPPRVHVTWQPKEFAGVQCIRKTWDRSDGNTLPRTPSSFGYRSSRANSLTRHQQPPYLGGYRTQDERQGRFENGYGSRQSSTLPRDTRPGFSSPPNVSNSKPLTVQDRNWNVVSSPTPQKNANHDENLPQWAKGYGDDYDYDDVLVV